MPPVFSSFLVSSFDVALAALAVLLDERGVGAVSRLLVTVTGVPRDALESLVSSFLVSPATGLPLHASSFIFARVVLYTSPVG